MEKYHVTPLEATVPVAEFLETSVDVERFLGCCRDCPNYNKRWSCPPLPFDPMEFWKSYQTLKLYARVLTPASDTSVDELMSGLRDEKGKLLRELLSMEGQIPNSRSLAAGSCITCEECTRKKDIPCCHPEVLRYSIEALGGDVGEIMERYFHHPLKWIEKGKLPDYLTLVGGLLIK